MHSRHLFYSGTILLVCLILLLRTTGPVGAHPHEIRKESSSQIMLIKESATTFNADVHPDGNHLLVTRHPMEESFGEDSDISEVSAEANGSAQIVFGSRAYSVLHYFDNDNDSDYLRLFRPVIYRCCTDLLYKQRKIQL